MNQWWQMWRGYFTPDDCERIKTLGMSYRPQEGTIGHGGTSKVDNHFRRSTIRWVDRSRHNEDHAWLFHKVDHVFQASNANAFNFNIAYFNDLQFTEYAENNEGKYDWHEDLTWTSNKPMQRKLSFVAQLTPPEAYTGGNLQLDTGIMGGKDMAPGESDLRSLGTVIVFPSFLRHRVTPVESGIRHSLVSWCLGSPFT